MAYIIILRRIILDIKCFNCGNVHNCNYCPNCGAPAKQNIVTPNYQVKNTYNQDGFNAKSKKSGCLIIFLAFFAFVVISAICSIFVNDSETEKSPNNISEFRKITGTSSEQEIAILDVLKNCGIDPVDTIEHDELLDDMNEEGEKGYRISCDIANNIILYLSPGNTVNSVRYLDHDLYDGKLISTLSDYVLTFDEQSDLQISCQKAIKNILASPSTAKFPNILKWKFWKEDGNIYVQSYVDSQNAFGAELRSEFKFTLSESDYTIESLIFDGDEIIDE